MGFNATEYTVSEADGTIAIQITKYGATTRAIDVEFSTQDDTATGKLFVYADPKCVVHAFDYYWCIHIHP